MIYSFKHQSLFRPISRPSTPSTPPDSPVVGGGVRTLSRAPFHLRHSPMAPVTSPARAPLIHDGSYLQTLGLRLTEAVSKVLAQPSCPGRGRALGDMIAFELEAARDNNHLYRAILRALQKPLSVLLSNLSALLLPLLSSPAFLEPSAPTPQMPTPTVAQLHALAIADFAGELLSSFDDLALGIDADGRGDGLNPIRTGLVSLIGRVTTPLITRIREELTPPIDALKNPSQTSTLKAKGSAHPSIIALQSSVPVYSRALARYGNIHHSDTLLASFLISIVWQALIALSHRPMPQSSTPVLSEKGHHPPSPRITSATSPRLFNLKRGPSRPVSPVITPTAATDARALYEIFSQFPRPTHTQVAREAVDEAFAHLEALVALLEVTENPSFFLSKTSEEIADEIRGLTDELPTLIALPVLLHMQYFEGVLGSEVSSVATFLNVPEDVYRKDCLAGFGRAEQCGPAVARRILDVIYTRPIEDASTHCFIDWLDAHLSQDDH